MKILLIINKLVKYNQTHFLNMKNFCNKYKLNRILIKYNKICQKIVNHNKQILLFKIKIFKYYNRIDNNNKT